MKEGNWDQPVISHYQAFGKGHGTVSGLSHTAAANLMRFLRSEPPFARLWNVSNAYCPHLFEDQTCASQTVSTQQIFISLLSTYLPHPLQDCCLIHHPLHGSYLILMSMWYGHKYPYCVLSSVVDLGGIAVKEQMRTLPLGSSDWWWSKTNR